MSAKPREDQNANYGAGAPAELFARADTAFYTAKAAGRNTVRIAGEPHDSAAGALEAAAATRRNSTRQKASLTSHSLDVTGDGWLKSQLQRVVSRSQGAGDLIGPLRIRAVPHVALSSEPAIGI